MAPYQYLPLVDDEIRLLSLSPRCSGEPRIRINIQKLSSTHRPQYEALSYVWGSKRFLWKITVDETDKNEHSEHVSETKTPNHGAANSSLSIRTSTTPRSRAIFRQAAQRPRGKLSLSITANLAQALPYLQLEDEERVLWIDAICIDQDNPTERGQQVGRMADIYKMADRVVIWLGPADRHTQLAIETLDRLAAEVDVNFVTEEISEHSEESLSRLICQAPTFKSLISLFQRPWFERLWIWQEAHARPDNAIVLVGNYSIMWLTIRKFLMIYSRRPRETPRKLQPLLARAIKLSRPVIGGDLITLLQSTTHCKCADDRDRIFALLGMLEPWKRLNIEPDYAKSAADIFKQVVLQQLNAWQRLDVLRNCDLLHKSDGMPSWVPSWSKNFNCGAEQRVASSNTPAEAEYDGKGTLRVSGVEFGVVKGLIVPGLFDDAEYNKKNWPNFVLSFFSLLPAHETEGDLDPTMDLMMRTLCWNYFVHEALEPVLFSIIHVKGTLLRWRAYLANKMCHLEPPPISAGDMEFYGTIVELAANYSLFRTTEGHLGLAPRLAAQGDKVCVVLGCNTPLVLRLVSDDQWSIVGDCYVHDIADGGALLSSLPESFQAISQRNSRTGTPEMAFKNMQTNEIQVQDPRITEPLPAGWEVGEHENESYYQLFRNKEQNLYTWHDPRLTPDALRARGVKLKTFNLV